MSTTKAEKWFLVFHEGSRHGHIRLFGPFPSRKSATAAGYDWYQRQPITRAHEVLMEVLLAGDPRGLLPVAGMVGRSPARRDHAMTPAQRAEFNAWLAMHKFRFYTTPTPQRMLASPESLTGTQRAWLRKFVAKIEEKS